MNHMRPQKPSIFLLPFTVVFIMVDLLVIHYVRAIRRTILRLGIGGVSLAMILFTLRIE
jgi:hypothetical protein